MHRSTYRLFSVSKKPHARSFTLNWFHPAAEILHNKKRRHLGTIDSPICMKLNLAVKYFYFSQYENRAKTKAQKKQIIFSYFDQKLVCWKRPKLGFSKFLILEASFWCGPIDDGQFCTSSLSRRKNLRVVGLTIKEFSNINSQ